MQQRVGLSQHDRAGEPGLDLHGQDAHLLSIGGNGLLQELDLGVQQSQRVVDLRNIRLNREPDHGRIVGTGDELRPRGLEPSTNTAPYVDLVGQIDRDQPVVDRGGDSHGFACEGAFPIRGGALTRERGAGRDRRGEITARDTSERARLVHRSDRLRNRLVRSGGRRDQPIELGLTIKSPPFRRDERSVSARRRGLETGRRQHRRPLVVRSHHAPGEQDTQHKERGSACGEATVTGRLAMASAGQPAPP